MRYFLCILLFGILWVTRADAVDITLSWTANTETDLAGYKIYQSTVSGQYGAPVMTVGKVTTQTLTLPTLTVDRTYFFTITAYDLASNESGKSAEVSKLVAGVPALTSPGIPLLTVTPKTTELMIAWAPVPDGAGGIARIDIRLGSPTDHWGLMRSQTCPTSPCTISGLVSNTPYQIQAVAYRVDAGVNVFGALSTAVTVSTTLPPIDPPPAIPKGLQIVSQSAAQIVILASLSDCPGGVRTSTKGSTSLVAKRTLTCG